jgi:hypothetical protein
MPTKQIIGTLLLLSIRVAIAACVITLYMLWSEALSVTTVTGVLTML